MWVEKYRPVCLEDVVSHPHIVETLNRFVQGEGLPHLLFYGPPGTGKTSTILACARKLYGDARDKLRASVLELNASDDRGIDVVRTTIKEFATTRNMFERGKPKLVVLDEADSMTHAAQDALRRVIEKHVQHVRFCLICNDISKITAAIQSRCTVFRFFPLGIEAMGVRLDLAIREEGLSVTSEGREAILRVGAGDMRRVLNTLQYVASFAETIDAGVVYSSALVPAPSQVQEMLQSLLSQDFDACYARILLVLDESGYPLSTLITCLAESLMEKDLSAVVQIYLFGKLADLEVAVAAGGCERVHLGALVGIFQLARNLAE